MTNHLLSYFVLGGGGFIGTNLCHRLAARGARVRAFGRSFSFPEAMTAVDLRLGDLRHADALAAAIEAFDVVYHLVHATPPQSANSDMAGNIGRGKGHSVREIVSTIQSLLGNELKIVWKDARPIDLPVSIVSPERTQQVLGWLPRTSLEEGMRDHCVVVRQGALTRSAATR